MNQKIRDFVPGCFQTWDEDTGAYRTHSYFLNYNRELFVYDVNKRSASEWVIRETNLVALKVQ